MVLRLPLLVGMVFLGIGAVTRDGTWSYIALGVFAGAGLAYIALALAMRRGQR